MARNPEMIHAGERFGRLTVVAFRFVQSNRQRVYECDCACGKSCLVTTNRLIHGKTKSCGCLRFENPQNRTHGMSSKSNRTYRIWMGMRYRCNNPHSKIYKYYGGRGIKVCSKWDDFLTFLSDMGAAPVGLSIDRIDNDRGYEPDNCRWADRLTQSRNRRKAA